ncbi:T9SS type A sorting domain-containing protein [Flavimarina sp. Hel_I_48]|uniref:T9SS type A sorting domain-containing protein n=1 Tax=Flavimarina sp. Hel_I_48 TaxID=1392488 RepID=UPI0004DF54C9|nr:T9SS type A sorting domain-containing protein [Flavimarina sp. Hel_I_48]
MKNIYPKLLFFFLPVIASAQLHIQKNNTSGSTDNVYIYNKGEILYVQQDISLLDGSAADESGNIYLRDEGQLIQGDDTNNNSGKGIVSVYQEGIVNQWDYHFWTSPISDPLDGSLNAAASGNTMLNLASTQTASAKGGGIFSVTDALESNPAGFLPAPNYNGIASNSNNSVFISSYWLNKYTMGTEYSNWNQIKETGDLNPGEGFTMKGVGGGTGTNQIYDFRGRPNNGTIKVAVAADQNTLVGNPYPSAMDLNFYLLSNSGADVSACKPGATPTAVGEKITGIAYFWESDPNTQSHYLVDYQGGYATYSPVDCAEGSGIYTRATFSKYDRDGNPVESSGGPSGDIPGRRYAPVGQGFFVVGNAALSGTDFVEAHNEFRVFKKENAATSTFKKAERIDNKSLDEVKNEAPEDNYSMPQVRLMVSINDTYMRELVAAFSESATLGLDNGADGENISFLDTDISYHLPESTIPYCINVLPYDADLKLPLAINAGGKTNTYGIKVSGINQDVPGVWIYDNEMDEYHDILHATYDLSLPKGVYNDRFTLVFKDDNPALDIAKEIKSSFDVLQNNKIAQLRVLNPKAVSLKEIAVFDISGRQVAGKLNEGETQEVTLSSANWSDGIYIVRVVTRDNIEFAKKIQVANKN